MRLLLVEDNAKLSELIAAGLAGAGFDTDRVGGVAAAEDALRATQYAALIVDLGLPDGDGRALVSSLRAQGKSMPILMLTARGTVGDKVSSLESGADDYLIKPFAFEELIARIRAILRRSSDFLGNVLKAGNVTLDTIARQVFVDGKSQHFSAREVTLLEILIRRPGLVIPKGVVEGHLFGLSEDVRSNAVEVYVYRLRKQLEEVKASIEVRTVRGVGYILRESER